MNPSESSTSFFVASKFAAFFKRSIARNVDLADLGLVDIVKNYMKLF
jgi:hypothetical protein